MVAWNLEDSSASASASVTTKSGMSVHEPLPGGGIKGMMMRFLGGRPYLWARFSKLLHSLFT